MTWGAKVKTLAEAMARDVTVGATGAGSATVVGPTLYNALLGTHFKIIQGYNGSGQINLAMQRGELDGHANSTYLVAGDPRKEAIANFMSLAVSVARPFAAPPGVREDRVALLRRAFDATMRDPEFLGEAQKMNSDIDPMSGAETQSAIARILGTPKEVIAQVQRRWGERRISLWDVHAP